MMKYYKRDAESDLGEGIVYLEIENDWPSRQVEVYGVNWRWADEEHNEWLADQPLSELDLGKEFEISKAEFEKAWMEAKNKCPPSL